MPLSLIMGPPNSGRTGRVLDAFRAGLERDPVLVVPTADDAERFERELSSADALLGGSIVTFGGLTGELARTLELPWDGGAGEAQRIWLARAAAARAEAPTLRRSASRPGFAAALAELIEELQAAGVSPASLADAAESDYERDLATLYETWMEEREAAGATDGHAQLAAITAALRGGEAEAWGRRPVAIYGFDDLTGEQLELVGALARATDVTVAITYDPGRPGLTARARLHNQLLDLVPEDLLAGIERLEADPSNTPSKLLAHIDASFLDPEAEQAGPDGSLTLLRAAGDRIEIELVGSHIARLLADGADPERIAIVVRDPGAAGTLWSRGLEALGVPVAVEGAVPVTATAAGQALAAALRLAGPDGEPADLVRFLRAPARAHPGAVDRLEREIRRKGMRSAADAEAAWERIADGRSLGDIARLRDCAGAELLGRTGRLARDLAEYPVKRARLNAEAHNGGPRRNVPLPGASGLELRAAAEIARSLEQVAALDPRDLGPRETLEIVEAASVRLHPGPPRGRVRVVSPYRLRARRVEHLVCASLQDGEFPRRTSGSPLLGDDRRGALGLPDRSEPEQEERYLFAVCLSRPEQTLALSWRDTDTEGKAVARSPFVDEVCDLVAAPEAEGEDHADRVFAAIGRERGPSEVTAPPAQASSERELARTLALAGPQGWPAALAACEVPDASRGRVESTLSAAAAKLEPAILRPKNLRNPAILAELASREAFGPSTLEGFGECSYRWFINHELKPQRLDPTDEPLVLGGLAHAVLETLYREAPGSPRPTPATLATWRERAAELVESLAPEFDLPAGDPVSTANRRQVEGVIWAYLEDEARLSHGLAPEADLLEAKFGERDGDRFPALDLGDGVKVHGSIDRIDVTDAGGKRYGLVYDYKLSRSVTRLAELEDKRKLQPQLYALALRESLGIEPLGALYIPLKGTDDRKPRGILNSDLAELREGLPVVERNDGLSAEEFEAALERGRERAVKYATKMRAGHVRRDPIENECPRWCRYQAICRRERGVADPIDEEDEEEMAA